MIKDTLKYSNLYYCLSDNIKKGLQWLESTDLKHLKDGKYEINGNAIYASVQTYLTKENAKYENHKKYIDIQYMIKGAEKIGVTNIINCKSCNDYDRNLDLEFFDITKTDEYIELDEGSFVILYPHDAHKPSIYKDKKELVKKVVVKVAI